MIKRKEAIEGSKRFISILYFLGPKCYDICWDPKCVLSSCWTNKHCRVCQLSLWLVCAAVWWSTDCRSACSSTTLHTSLHCTTLQMHLQRKSAVWNCAKLCPAPARPLHAASTKPRHSTAAAYRKLGLKVDSRYDIGKQIFLCNFYYFLRDLVFQKIRFVFAMFEIVRYFSSVFVAKFLHRSPSPDRIGADSLLR